jgi:hypothetical protein
MHVQNISGISTVGIRCQTNLGMTTLGGAIVYIFHTLQSKEAMTQTKMGEQLVIVVL